MNVNGTEHQCLTADDLFSVAMIALIELIKRDADEIKEIERSMLAKKGIPKQEIQGILDETVALSPRVEIGNHSFEIKINLTKGVDNEG